MTAAFIGPTALILSGMFEFQQDRHAQDFRWHMKMMASNPDYQDDIARRQADKRAHGIGPEGMCRA